MLCRSLVVRTSFIVHEHSCESDHGFSHGRIIANVDIGEGARLDDLARKSSRIGAIGGEQL